MNRLRAHLRDVAAIALLLLLVLACTWRIALAGRVLAGGDVFTYFYPYWAEATRAIRSGRLPLWNSSLFMGVPFVANSQVGFFYPLNWPLWLLFPAHRAVHVTIVFHLCLAALNAYLWGRKALRLGPVASWTVGVLFALGGYMLAQMEHVNQVQGLAWLPLMLTLAHQIAWSIGDASPLADASASFAPHGTSDARPRRAACALAVVFALIVLTGHTQTAFISLFGVIAYTLAPLIGRSRRAGDLRPLMGGAALLGVAAMLGVLLAMVQILPTWQLSRLSVRAQGLPFRERVSFSLSPLYLGRALLPVFGHAIPLEHLEHVAYVGITGLALAVTGLMIDLRHRRGQQRGGLRPHRPVYLLVLLGLFFALGLYNPVYVVLARYVPGFAHFRVPARWLALYTIGVATLAGDAVQALWAGRSLEGRRLLVVAGSLVALILVAAAGLQLTGVRNLDLLTMAGWMALSVVSTALLLAASHSPRTMAVGLLTLLTGELLVASGALPQARATAPQAFTSIRPAVAHLLASEESDAAPRGRFLSMSDTTFDPGDLALIRQIYGPQLSEDQLYDYIVATKQKEILTPNLPLVFRVPAVDGYDGGILPLQRYVTLQRAFLSAAEVSIDGRLRENLTAIPEGRWLSLFNVQYVITDKLRDAWIDDVFYDLQFGARLSEGMAATVAQVPGFEATALGVVSHLEQGATLPEGAPVGVVRLGFVSGDVRTFQLRAGEDVPEASRDHEAGELMATRLSWSEPRRPLTITLEATMPAGTWVVRGISLIDERTGSFQSLVVSHHNRFRLVHSGDVKIYENPDVLPRAFIVPQAQLVSDDEAALRVMKDPSFDFTSRVVLDGREASGCGLSDVPADVTPGPAVDISQSTRATIERYRPRQVVIETALPEPGYLLLTDAYYPGWAVTVDGEPASICRADLLFRAVRLQAGTHRVVFSFRPTLQRVGIAMSVAGLVVLLAIWHKRRIVENIGRCYNGVQR